METGLKYSQFCLQNQSYICHWLAGCLQNQSYVFHWLTSFCFNWLSQWAGFDTGAFYTKKHFLAGGGGGYCIEAVPGWMRATLSPDPQQGWAQLTFYCKPSAIWNIQLQSYQMMRLKWQWCGIFWLNLVQIADVNAPGCAWPEPWWAWAQPRL